MNKSDIKLIIIILLIAITVLFVIAIIDKNNSKEALVYYDNNLVLTIDLNESEEKIYIVDGFNGEVKIIAGNGKIKVDEEESPLHLCSKQGFIEESYESKSPLHLCSKQGFIEESYESIVCLPNKIVIKISSKKEKDLDTILR